MIMKFKITSILLTSFALLYGLRVLASESQPSKKSSMVSSIAKAVEKPDGPAGIGVVVEGGAPGLEPKTNASMIFMNNDLVQAIGYEPFEKNITFYSAERDPSAAIAEEQTKANFSTAYEVKKIVHAGQANVFYVNGVGRGGADIIEEWNISVIAGAYFATLSGSAQPIGTPTPLRAIDTGILGDIWTAPIGRTDSIVATRTELYRDGSLGDIRGIVADPDGRFILFLAGASLYRLDIGPTLTTPVEVLTASDFPEIFRADFVEIIGFSPSRIVLVIAIPGNGFASSRAWITDADNDGLFDGPPVIFDGPTWTALGFADLLGEDFIHFF
jgi:hypothetical protein